MYSWRFSLPNARIKVTLRHDNHHHRIGIFPCTLRCKQDNRARSYKRDFYRAGRRSPWYMVAFGMIGASISGITFVSVPGMVVHSDMTYIQTCLGFILGYFAIALVLLPLYYKHNLTSIYTYLGRRLGDRSYKTGSWFFLVTKMTMASVRFYVVCIILQRFVFSAADIPLLSP